MELSLRRKLYAQLGFEPVGPGEPRFVPLGDEGGQHDLIDRMAFELQLSDRPRTLMVTGGPGAGLSTMLIALSSRLQASGHRTILVDASEHLDLSAPVSEVDLAMLLLAAVEQERRKWEPAPSVYRRFASFLGSGERAMQLDVGGGTIDTLNYALKVSPAERSRLELALRPRSQDLQRLVLEALEEVVHPRGGESVDPLVILLDGLDHLAGTSSSWFEVMASAERLFESSMLDMLPVHVVCTAPVAMLTRAPRRRQLRFLPMLAVAGPDGSPRPAAMEQARKLAFRRIHPPALQEMLGADASSRLDQLILWSGGVPRTILRMLRECLLSERLPVPDHRFEALLRGDTSLQMVATSQDIEILHRIADRHQLNVVGDERRHALERLLTIGLVLGYVDGVQWFAPHPACRPWLDASPGATPR